MNVTPADGVLVQGITGKQGRFWTARMKESGTRIVAGVSPGKGGHDIDGVPVYGSVPDAARNHQLDVTVLFVPPLAARAAVLDALSAGVRKVVLLTEHIPTQDVIEVLAEAATVGAQVLGPNTAGLVVPGQTSIGIMPAFAQNIFRPGTVGIVSRSGSLGTLFALQTVRAGFGQSLFLGIGGDPILGTTTLEALKVLDRHPHTRIVVVLGELGGVMEEQAADYIPAMSKPVIAFIAGRSAPPGRRMGHAGAITIGTKGSGESKVKALRRAGAWVLDVPSELCGALAAGHRAGDELAAQAERRHRDPTGHR